jgi:HSP20 family protein
MEVPGVGREEIDLRVENDVLTVRGQRPHPASVSDEQYLRGERRFGTFNRSFRLPPVLDTGKVKAEYRDGVLTVTLPRKEEARPKQIKVDVN